MDPYSKSVVGIAIDIQNREDLIMDAFEMALRNGKLQPN